MPRLGGQGHRDSRGATAGREGRRKSREEGGKEGRREGGREGVRAQQQVRGRSGRDGANTSG